MANNNIPNDLQRLILGGLRFAIFFMLFYFGIIGLTSHVKFKNIPLVYRIAKGVVWKGGNTYVRFRQFDVNERYDVLIFGSSKAARSLNPIIFSQYKLNAFNLATDDQTPLNTNELIQHFVRPGKCGLVIIDLYEKVFSQDPLESNSDIIQNCVENELAFKTACHSNDIRCWNGFFIRLALSNCPPIYERNTKLIRGYKPLYDTISIHSNFSIPQYRCKESAIQNFDGCLTWLEKSHVPYLLISQPDYRLCELTNYQKFLKDIEPVLVKHHAKISETRNAKDLLGFSDYSDPIHLNVNGARKFSLFILNNFVLPSIKVAKNN